MREVVLILSLILTVALSACANDPSGRAREELELSRSAYMQCLDRNPETPAICSGLKAAFDQNMKEYMETSNPNLSP
jgi:hypothetical protein